LKPKIPDRFIFIVRKEHVEKYSVDSLLRLIAPGCIVIPISEVTQGAACTVLLAKQYINNEDDLIIANSDQYVDIDFNDYVDFSKKSGSDGTILTFYSTHPKWSFARLDENGNVMEVAEKKPISDKATVGIYYFTKGKDFCEAAERMIEKDIRVNNEFYVCPVYNEMILQNKIIKIYHMERGMYGLGTPEDLDEFLKGPVMSKL